METAKTSVILLTCVVLMGGAVQATGKQAVEDISGTRTASCLVRVTCNPAVLPLDTDTIEDLLRSSGVGGKAAREVLGVPLVDKFLNVDPVSGFSGESVGRSAKSSGAPRPMSREESYDDEYMMTMMEEEYVTEEYGDYRMMMEESKQPYAPTRSGSRRPRRTSAGRRPLDTYQAQNCSACHARSEMANAAARGCPVAAGLPRPAVEQELLFRLEVDLREEIIGQAVKPAAEEFMNALVDNLRQALVQAFDKYRSRLDFQVKLAVDRRDEAKAQLSKLLDQVLAVSQMPARGLDPADQAVYEQLDQIVDLSQLSPTMPFAEAIDILSNSVEPPLKTVVLWRDLLDNAEIEPTTAINMDGIQAVRLGAALRLLLRAVAGGFADLGYVVQDGVVTVTTADSLPQKLETRVYEIPGPFPVADELAEVIQETVEPDSWFDAGGEGTIKAYMGKKLVILQTPRIHQEIQEFLKTIRTGIPTDIPADVSEEALLADKHNMVRDRQRLEMDIARSEARRSAIEQQIAKISDQATARVQGDPIMVELQRLLELQVENLERMKKLVEVGRAATQVELANAEEKLARTKIELAQRREELAKAAGGNSLAKLNSDLADVMIELAEKQAELGVVGRQLKEIEKQLTMLTAVDPAVTRIRLATHMVEVTEQRLSELKSRLADLQPPTVTILGGN